MFIVALMVELGFTWSAHRLMANQFFVCTMRNFCPPVDCIKINSSHNHD
jgi:hypothetical protein